MVEVKKECLDGYTYVLGYNIKEESEPQVFEIVQKIYTDNNKWNKKNILSDICITKCYLCSLLQHLMCGRQTLEEAIENDCETLQILENVLDGFNTVEKTIISLPYRTKMNNRGVPEGFRWGKDTFYPLSVKVNNFDVSLAFQDFDVYEDRAVDEAVKLFDDLFIPANKNDRNAVMDILAKKVDEKKELGLK